MGLVLLLLGASLFLLSYFNATRIDTVIDVSFVLEIGEVHGPYENGTYYHTRVMSKSTLMGEVMVEGGGVNFTANGYNTQHLKNVFVNQNYSFIVDPADDLYTFNFDNAVGSTQVSIRFTLREKWMNILSLIPSFIILSISAPTGIVLIVTDIRRKQKLTEP